MPKVTRLKKKWETFCQYFTKVGYRSHGNASESARLAGFAEKSAGRTGQRLLSFPIVQSRIKELEDQKENSTKKTREQKRQIAWDNYIESKTSSDKRFWWQEVCKLDGDYIQKTEIKDNREESQRKQKEIIAEEVRKSLKNTQKEYKLTPNNTIIEQESLVTDP